LPEKCQSAEYEPVSQEQNRLDDRDEYCEPGAHGGHFF
jgi:hypothetical protein